MSCPRDNRIEDTHKEFQRCLRSIWYGVVEEPFQTPFVWNWAKGGYFAEEIHVYVMVFEHFRCEVQHNFLSITPIPHSVANQAQRKFGEIWSPPLFLRPSSLGAQPERADVLMLPLIRREQLQQLSDHWELHSRGFVMRPFYKKRHKIIVNSCPRRRIDGFPCQSQETSVPLRARGSIPARRRFLQFVRRREVDIIGVSRLTL
mmetsp:Transcript_29393/g.77702  ORF Transcript_29393/g.77702 Transcript_29393/m.77702 type:complete len:203 (+) Transcript_29393:1970-2578(+)